MVILHLLNLFGGNATVCCFVVESVNAQIFQSKPQKYSVMVARDVTPTQREYLIALVNHADPAVTATEIADVRGVTKQAAYSALEKLVSKGIVEKKKVGSRSVIYWSTPEARKIARSDG